MFGGFLVSSQGMNYKRCLLKTTVKALLTLTPPPPPPPPPYVEFDGQSRWCSTSGLGGLSVSSALALRAHRKNPKPPVLQAISLGEKGNIQQ